MSTKISNNSPIQNRAHVDTCPAQKPAAEEPKGLLDTFASAAKDALNTDEWTDLAKDAAGLAKDTLDNIVKVPVEMHQRRVEAEVVAVQSLIDTADAALDMVSVEASKFVSDKIAKPVMDTFDDVVNVLEDPSKLGIDPKGVLDSISDTIQDAVIDTVKPAWEQSTTKQVMEAIDYVLPKAADAASKTIEDIRSNPALNAIFDATNKAIEQLEPPIIGDFDADKPFASIGDIYLNAADFLNPLGVSPMITVSVPMKIVGHTLKAIEDPAPYEAKIMNAVEQLEIFSNTFQPFQILHEVTTMPDGDFRKIDLGQMIGGYEGIGGEIAANVELDIKRVGETFEVAVSYKGEGAIGAGAGVQGQGGSVDLKADTSPKLTFTVERTGESVKSLNELIQAALDGTLQTDIPDVTAKSIEYGVNAKSAIGGTSPGETFTLEGDVGVGSITKIERNKGVEEISQTFSIGGGAKVEVGPKIYATKEMGKLMEELSGPTLVGREQMQALASEFIDPKFAELLTQSSGDLSAKLEVSGKISGTLKGNYDDGATAFVLATELKMVTNNGEFAIKRELTAKDPAALADRLKMPEDDLLKKLATGDFLAEELKDQLGADYDKFITTKSTAEFTPQDTVGVNMFGTKALYIKGSKPIPLKELFARNEASNPDQIKARQMDAHTAQIRG